MNPTREQISKLASQLWQKDGCKSGLDWKYWLQAEKELSSPPPPAVPTASPKLSATRSRARA